ncbi:MAG TPA: hypothetical protein DER68_06520 [Ruminococcaceae bacterium]|nr:hypothetical protein [Oscillospiraceae bacterium]
MKHSFAILIPLCIIGFVGFWISTSILGTSNAGVLGSGLLTDDSSEAAWSATNTVNNAEYNATIVANSNLTLELADVQAVVTPTDADDIKVYVKNTSKRSVNVSLSRDDGNKTKISINTNIFGTGLFGINLNPFSFITDGSVDDRYVQIEIPKKTFESAKITLGSGKAIMKGIIAEEYDIDLGSGSLDFDCGLTKCKDFRLDMGSGSGTFRGVTPEKYDINMGSGSCTISSLTGKGDIDMGSGSLELSFMDSPAGKFDMGSGHTTMIIPDNSNTTFKFDIGSGGVDFNACGINETRRNHKDDDIVLGNGENTFIIDIGSGSVDVASSGKASVAEQSE